MEKKNKFLILTLCISSIFIILFGIFAILPQKTVESTISQSEIIKLFGGRITKDDIIVMYRENEKEILEIVDFISNYELPEDKKIVIDNRNGNWSFNLQERNRAGLEDITDTLNNDMKEKIDKVFSNSRFADIKSTFPGYGNWVVVRAEGSGFQYVNGVLITLTDEEPDRELLKSTLYIYNIEKLEDNLYYFEAE